MPSTVQVTVAVAGTPSKEELLKIFTSEIDEFSQWMANNPDWKQQGALTRPERVLLLTYLMQKYAGNLDAKKYG